MARRKTRNYRLGAQILTNMVSTDQSPKSEIVTSIREGLEGLGMITRGHRLGSVYVVTGLSEGASVNFVFKMGASSKLLIDSPVVSVLLAVDDNTIEAVDFDSMPTHSALNKVASVLDDD